MGTTVENRRSQNSYPEAAFQDCLTKWEESAAHSILARRFHANKGRIHSRRPTCHSHFSLATRRTIHSGWRVIHPESQIYPWWSRPYPVPATCVCRKCSRQGHGSCHAQILRPR